MLNCVTVVEEKMANGVIVVEEKYGKLCHCRRGTNQ